ncbi:TetR/AcrR family transcriptional regulator [Hahella ganghwensis]|uniref:TetR/AcrR family transcriptional regulator n=1 Tax=Hahella ganghwensis TaxID=286420 RepID=UPI000378F5E3|nr:TetR/AcrR family transcriptional regulator [Hahella ganghwensis]
MAYRETPKIAARKQYIREKILQAAAELTAEQGFSGTSVSAIAARAGVATGSVYRYFPNKSALCTEVFRTATSREIAQVKSALEATGNVKKRLHAAVSTFADRALRSRRLAYSLIAEPVDPQLDQERLNYREHYANLFAAAIQEGIASEELCPQHPQISGAALVGALAEALIGPLAARIRDDTTGSASPKTQYSEQQMIKEITAFCLRAVGINETVL